MTEATPIATPARSHLSDLALLLLLATLWGASYSFIKLGVASIPPITLIAARTLIAGAVLVVVMQWRGIAFPRDPAVWRRFLIQACLNSAVPFTLIAWAETSVDAGLAGILNAGSPIFVFLISMVLFRAEAAAGRKLFGVVAGMAGVCLIIGVEALSGVGREVMAQLALVAATACYGAAALFGRNFKGLDPILPAAGSLICGAAILLPVSLIVDRPWTLSPSTESIEALLALSLFSTALAFIIYFRLIERIGSVGTTSVAYLRVPIGVAISVVFLGERLSATAWAGLALVFIGVIAMTLPERGGSSR
jgi:drug/metabolite transporter (DMT)-like permease